MEPDGLKRFCFPIDIVILLLGTFLSRVGYYMVWPYMSVVLFEKFNISPVQIGSIFFGATFISCILSIYISHISDRHGRKKIIILGLLVSAVAFYLLGVCTRILHFFVLLALVSIGRAFIESCSKAYIGDSISSRKQFELCQYTRYLFANIGVAVGPWIGIKLGLVDTSTSTTISAILYFSYMILAICFLKERRFINKSSSFIFIANFTKVIRIDRFAMFMFCNLLLMIVYASYDTSLIQYVTRSGPKDFTRVIANLVITNSVTVIVFQIPVFYILKHVSASFKIFIGILLISIAQLLFAVANLADPLCIYFAAFMLSIGEVIVMPTINVAIDQLAPEHLRGIAFGVASIANIGTSISPLVGGLILQLYGGKTLFTVLFFVCILILTIYYIYVMPHKNKYER